VFARLLAAFCLIHLVVGMCWASSDGPANSELIVYLHADSTHSIDYMKRELGPLMLTAGFRVEWRDAQTAGQIESSAALAVVDLHGACGLPAGNFTLATGELKDLASTSVSRDTVQPFVTLNCAAMTRLLGPALLAEAGARRDYLYGRAMARVLAHELYHVLANTREHAHDGIGKPSFSVGDLLGERFAFEQTTRAKMESSSATFSDAPAGR
jgi:hypothetical protein